MTLYGPSFPSDPLVDSLQRVCARVRQKAEQLPADAAGLVVLHAPLFLLSGRLAFEGLVALLQAVVREVPHAHAVAVILVRYPDKETDGIHWSGDNFVSVATESAIFRRKTMVVRNPARRSRTDDALVDRLFQATLVP